MSKEYAEHRIKEALKVTGGNMVRARQQVIAWTYEDAKLLHELAKPHLSGIVAYNIERVASGRAEAAKTPPPPKKSRPTKAVKAKDSAVPQRPANKEEKFGLEILKAVAGQDTAVFGLEDTGAPQKRRGVSQGHIDAIQAIASKKPSE